VAKKVAEAGHEIGNHSMTHPQLNRLPAEKVEWEIGQTQENIIQATGFTPVWFRPPYGAFRTDQGPTAASRGLGVVWWTVDPRDWAEPGIPKVTDAILKGTVPGSIILTHDIHKPTVEALPAILDELLARGFEFTNISGFLGSPYGGPPGTVPPGITPAAPYPPAAIPGAPAAPAAVPAAPEAPVAEPVKA
jgi:peptidoglycan/xylan/chitin deacetylase (PgdA/CDA1 family)